MRTQGHLEGLKAAKRVVKAAANLGVSYLTLYTFSTENWKRAAEEVGFIMGMVKQYLKGEMDFYRENNIRIRHAGNREGLPADILQDLDEACAATGGFNGLQVILALNYGGRDEIVRAIKKLIAASNAEGTLLPTPHSLLPTPYSPLPTQTITAEKLSQYMDNPDIPDPDLIIRTAGEFRTSNFLLWEGAYAEYYISDKLWPDWSEGDLEKAILSYKNRDRRFGAAQ
jgi:undecaprenyl diphosphate synthase